MSDQTPPRIAFQGALGAYSHEACLNTRPDMIPVPCTTFEGTIRAVREGRADLAMLPVENTTYGRVADIHRLLPQSGLRIIGEGFVRVRIALMARPGVALEDVKHVRAHMVLLPQARSYLERNGISWEAAADSAKPTTPALAAAIASWFGKPVCAAAEDSSTIEPPLLRIAAVPARTAAKAVSRFAASVARHSSADVR